MLFSISAVSTVKVSKNRKNGFLYFNLLPTPTQRIFYETIISQTYIRELSGTRYAWLILP